MRAFQGEGEKEDVDETSRNGGNAAACYVYLGLKLAQKTE